MARKKKRARGAGRKPQGSFVGKSMTLTTRITPVTRKDLEDLRQPGQSISQFAEEMLRTGLREAGPRGSSEPIRIIRYLITQAAVACRVFIPDEVGDWTSDPFTFRAFRLAVTQLLEWMEPAGAIVSPVDRFGEDTFRNMPGALVDSYRTPEARAADAAKFVWTRRQIGFTEEELELARNWKPFGDHILRMDKGMADARRRLGTTEKAGGR